MKLPRELPGEWIDRIARAGYTAKGLVYGTVGLSAGFRAAGMGGSTDGAGGALETIGEKPFGRIVLLATAAGLACYVLWRFVQAIFDPAEKGSDFKGVLRRVGCAISGLTYAGLAWTALRIAMAGFSDDAENDAKEVWTARIFTLPMGRWIVAGIGVTVVGVGLYHFYRVWTASFMKHYAADEMSGDERRWARRIGRYGLAARGVTFCIIGWLLVLAGWSYDSKKTDGLGDVLATISGGGLGRVMLGIVALGFVAYAVYCWSRARYRRFEV